MQKSSIVKGNILTYFKIIFTFLFFLITSSYFAWWGYGLTGKLETWGETIWDHYNWVGSLVFGVGVTAGILFVFFFIVRIIMRFLAEKTIGTVINVEAKKVIMKTRSDTHRALGASAQAINPYKNEMVTVFRKSFRFTAKDGQTYEIESNTETNQPLQEGEKVIVLYYPKRPQRAKLFSHLEYYALVYLFLIMAIVSTVIGGILLGLLD